MESDAFSTLRRATVRTLSGEQLPRGQTSGPLWFGDPTAGYTIAYVFRLADSHARGRQRYYALLALAGSDMQRAFEACMVIWNLFEQIAMHIVHMAEEVASRSAEDAIPPDNGQITPISSFLTGRTMDPDGFPRRSAAKVRANSIAELVDNENFFCELHMTFVGILQELGRSLGGIRVKSALDDPVSQSMNQKSEAGKASDPGETNQDEDEKEVQSYPISATPDDRPSIEAQSQVARCPTPLGGLVAHRHQVAV